MNDVGMQMQDIPQSDADAVLNEILIRHALQPELEDLTDDEESSSEDDSGNVTEIEEPTPPSPSPPPEPLRKRVQSMVVPMRPLFSSVQPMSRMRRVMSMPMPFTLYEQPIRRTESEPSGTHIPEPSGLHRARRTSSPPPPTTFNPLDDDVSSPDIELDRDALPADSELDRMQAIVSPVEPPSTAHVTIERPMPRVGSAEARLHQLGMPRSASGERLHSMADMSGRPPVPPSTSALHRVPSDHELSPVRPKGGLSASPSVASHMSQLDEDSPSKPRRRVVTFSSIMPMPAIERGSTHEHAEPEVIHSHTEPGVRTESQESAAHNTLSHPSSQESICMRPDEVVVDMTAPPSSLAMPRAEDPEIAVVPSPPAEHSPSVHRLRSMSMLRARPTSLKKIARPPKESWFERIDRQYVSLKIRRLFLIFAGILCRFSSGPICCSCYPVPPLRRQLTFYVRVTSSHSPAQCLRQLRSLRAEPRRTTRRFRVHLPQSSRRPRMHSDRSRRPVRLLLLTTRQLSTLLTCLRGRASMTRHTKILWRSCTRPE